MKLVRVALLAFLAAPVPILGQAAARTPAPAANPKVLWTFDTGG